MTTLRPLLALALLAIPLAACAPDARAPAGPSGMRAMPPPDVISPGNFSAGAGRDRVFDDNRGAPL
jgi:hypothetical protein